MAGFILRIRLGHEAASRLELQPSDPLAALPSDSSATPVAHLRGSACCHGEVVSATRFASAVCGSDQAFLGGLDGRFAGVVVDGPSVHLVTDPVGSVPLYYSLRKDELFVATDPSALSSHSGRRLDHRTLPWVLHNYYPIDDGTLLDDVKCVPSCSWWTVSSEGVERRVYFAPEEEKCPGFASEREFLEELDRSLLAIAQQSGRLLLGLSGGADSRLLALRMRKLGLDFEAYTFGSASASEEGDYHVAREIARQLEIPHHICEYDAKDFLTKARELILASGGLNSAYTSYPDGLRFLADFSGWTVVRGDEIFGWGRQSSDARHALSLLNLDTRRNKYLRLEADLLARLREEKGLPLVDEGGCVDRWKQRFYRSVRLPNFIMPVARYQMRHCNVALPFLSRSFQRRCVGTRPDLRSKKKIALDALRLASPPEIRDLPLARARNWSHKEPFLSLPPETLEHVMRTVESSEVLAELVDVKGVVGALRGYLSGGSRDGGLRRYLSRAYRNRPEWMRALDGRLPPVVSPAVLVKNAYAIHTFVEH